MSPLSCTKRARIHALLQSGYSARRVASLENVSHPTVIRTRQRAEMIGGYTDRPRSGRPPILSPRYRRIITRKVMTGVYPTAVEAQRFLNQEDKVNASANSVRRVLYRSGLRDRIKVKKPLLKKKHRQARMAFAQKYQHWTIDDWRRVM